MRSWIATGCLVCGLLHATDSWAGHDQWISQTAGDTLRISLQNAILTALERNPNLSIQRLDPAVARSHADEQRAAFDPTLTVSTTRDESKTQRFLGAQPNPFDMTSERTQYTAGLSQTLPTGTSISVDASVYGSTSSIYEPQYSGNIGITVTQSLLKGFGIAPNMADLRKARLDLEISRSELKAMAEGLLTDTEKAYWALYLAAEEKLIQEESLRLANRQLDESLERVAVGKLPELELAAVRAEVAKREGNLIDAQSRYEEARLDFLYLLNLADQTSWSTIPIPMDRPTASADSLEDVSVHEAVALEYRPDLQQARLDYEKGVLEVARTKNGLLPRLDFFITLGTTSYARTFGDALPDIDSPFYNVNAGISFDFPIPNRSARAQVKRAEKTREQLDYALENMARLAQMDIRAAYIEVLRTRRQIEATQVTRDLQKKNLEAEVEKFRVGKSTNLLVLQVQRDFTASKLDGIRAVVNYLDALVQFYLMEGTVLERRGIGIPSEL